MPVLPEYSDEQIIDAARQRFDGPIGYFYNKGFKMAYDLIKDSGGIHQREDIKDVYQTSFEIFLGYVQSKDFKLTSKLSTFLLGICKIQALNYRKRQKQVALSSFVEGDFEHVIDDAEEVMELENTWLIYTEEFDKMKLTKKMCYELLWLSMIEGKDYVSISQTLGRENTNSLKSQKVRCVKYLQREIFKRMNYE